MSNDAAAQPADDGVRASDAERQAVVDRLDAAAVEGRLDPAELRTRTEAAYAARTLSQLAVLTADLPRVGGSPVRPVGSVNLAGNGSAVAGATGPGAGGGVVPETAPAVIGVFGGSERRGRWRPARRESAVALFGGVVLDYREAAPLPDVLHLRATAVFGGIEVVVPEGTAVDLSGFSLFGGRSVKIGGTTPESGAIELRVHAVAVFGGVTVHTGGPGSA